MIQVRLKEIQQHSSLLLQDQNLCVKPQIFNCICMGSSIQVEIIFLMVHHFVHITGLCQWSISQWITDSHLHSHWMRGMRVGLSHHSTRKYWQLFPCCKPNTHRPSTRAPWLHLLTTVESTSSTVGGASPASICPQLYLQWLVKRASSIWMGLSAVPNIFELLAIIWVHTSQKFSNQLVTIPIALPVSLTNVLIGISATNMKMSSMIWHNVRWLLFQLLRFVNWKREFPSWKVCMVWQLFLVHCNIGTHSPTQFFQHFFAIVVPHLWHGS